MATLLQMIVGWMAALIPSDLVTENNYGMAILLQRIIFGWMATLVPIDLVTLAFDRELTIIFF